MSDLKPEKGTMESYVIGFLLSLLLTFIPYQLVETQTVKGTTLLITILAFAVLQMVVQVTFFLHLGRGPKPKWNLFFFIATIGIVILVVGGSIVIIDNLHYNMSPMDQKNKLVNDEGIYQIGGEETGACRGQHNNHQVTFEGGIVSPAVTTASKCDTFTFINEDKEVRMVTFGEHPAHGVYAGETDILVENGRNETITLSEAGKFKFHDHLDPKASGEFTVAP